MAGRDITDEDRKRLLEAGRQLLREKLENKGVGPAPSTPVASASTGAVGGAGYFTPQASAFARPNNVVTASGSYLPAVDPRAIGGHAVGSEAQAGPSTPLSAAPRAAASSQRDSNLASKVNELTLEKSKLMAKVFKLETAVEDLSSSNKQLRQRQGSAEEARSQVASLQEEVEEERSRSSVLQQQLAETADLVQASEQRLQAAVASVAHLQAEVQQSSRERQEIEVMLEKNTEMLQQAIEGKRQAESLVAEEKKRAAETEQSFKAQVDQLQERCRSTERVVEEKEQQIKILYDETTQRGKESQSTRSLLLQKNETIKQQQASVDQLSSENRSLSEKVTKLEQLATHSQQQLEQALTTVKESAGSQTHARQEVQHMAAQHKQQLLLQQQKVEQQAKQLAEHRQVAEQQQVQLQATHGQLQQAHAQLQAAQAELQQTRRQIEQSQVPKSVGTSSSMDGDEAEVLRGQVEAMSAETRRLKDELLQYGEVMTSMQANFDGMCQVYETKLAQAAAAPSETAPESTPAEGRKEGQTMEVETSELPEASPSAQLIAAFEEELGKLLQIRKEQRTHTWTVPEGQALSVEFMQEERIHQLLQEIGQMDELLQRSPKLVSTLRWALSSSSLAEMELRLEEQMRAAAVAQLESEKLLFAVETGDLQPYANLKLEQKELADKRVEEERQKAEAERQEQERQHQEKLKRDTEQMQQEGKNGKWFGWLRG